MKTMRDSGSALALIAASSVIIIMIGVFIFAMIRLLGGERELQYATDAGSLNVAKQLSVRPHYMTDPYKIAQFKFCGERDNDGHLLLRDATSNYPQGQPAINLRTYNKFVGQALLVAMNASAEGTPEAKRNASRLINFLNGPKGIADALTKDISATGNQTKESGPTAGQSFTSLYQSNSIRMLGKKPVAQKNRFFTVSYMEQRKSDRGATNLLMPTADQIPEGGANNNAIPKTAAGNYVRGYEAIRFPGISNGTSGILMGMSAQPDEQPHLASATDFKKQTQAPKDAVVPPNAFQSGSVEADKLTSYRLQSFSHSIIGVLDKKFTPSIPGGYLVVHNTSGNSNGTMADFSGVLDGELDTGIEVERNGNTHDYYFSATGGMFERWHKYVKEGATNPKDAPEYDEASGKINDLWVIPATKNGAPDTTAKPRQVTYDEAVKHAYNVHCLCSDTNTHSDRRTGGRPICKLMLPAFEKQYCPDFDGNYTKPASNSANLTAAETLKADVEHLFNDCGYLSLDAGQNLTTGMRLYNNGIGTNTPWPQYETATDNVKFYSGKGPFEPKTYNFPQISHNGNLKELIQQVCFNNKGAASAYIARYSKFIRNRLAQISGKSGDALSADVEEVMNTTIPMGPDLYIYYKDDGRGNMTKLQALVTEAPPMFGFGVSDQPATSTTPSFTSAKADGASNSELTVDSSQCWPVRFQKDIIGTLVNSLHDHMVDKHPFQYHRGKIALEQKIVLTPSSGFNNLLGEITLQETVTPSAKLFFGQPN